MLRRLFVDRRRRSSRRWKNRAGRLGHRQLLGRSCQELRSCGRAARVRRGRPAGKRSSSCTSQPAKVSFVKRALPSRPGYSWSKSATLETNCAWACAWLNPPMMPKAMRSSPRVMKAGMMVCSGRLCAGERVGRFRIEAEERTAIVEDEAGAVGDHAGTEILNNCFESARPCCRRDRRR